MRSLFLGLAVAASALVSSPAMADDTQIADFIQSRLQVDQQQGRLRGFNVDLQVEDGTVWFKGYVSTPEQEKLILRTAQEAGYLGVVKVVDNIEVRPASTQADYQSTSSSPPQLRPAAYQQQLTPVIPAGYSPQAGFDGGSSTRLPQAGFSDGSSTRQPLDNSVPLPAAGVTHGAPEISYGSSSIEQPIGMPYSGEVITGEVISGDPLPFATAGAPAPGPSGGAGFAAPSGSPNLPGYAWPGYAARSNFGAVSYPRQYSASAWPFIGPFYPYPQVPLGWRKVSLEWDDGFWFLDFSDKSRH